MNSGWRLRSGTVITRRNEGRGEPGGAAWAAPGVSSVDKQLTVNWDGEASRDKDGGRDRSPQW